MNTLEILQGVKDWTTISAVYDVSAHFPTGGVNGGNTYTLSGALAMIPNDIRKGGMSIRFVSSSDNKYVQYRLMADEWSINTDNWSFCGDDVLVENPEYIEVKTDSEEKVLEGIKTGGTKEVNIPTTFKDDVTIEGNINNERLDETFNTKVDKVEGEGLISTEVSESFNIIDNDEFISIELDNDSKIISATKKDGRKYFAAGYGTDAGETYSVNSIEYAKILLDAQDRIIGWINRDGSPDWVTGVPKPIKRRYDLLLYKEGLLPFESGDFNENMTRREIIQLYNSKIAGYAHLCNCRADSMYELLESDSNDMLIWKINHNFRDDVVFQGLEKDQFVSLLNKYFKIPVYRFADAKFDPEKNVDVSLTVGNPTIEGKKLAEPSSLISDDGEKIELFSTSPVPCYLESSDGLTWSLKQNLVFSDSEGNILPAHPIHFSVNKIDGLYFLTGSSENGINGYMDLYTSEDRIHFTFRGHIFQAATPEGEGGTDLGNGLKAILWGNSYLFRDNGGTYYFYYEMSASYSGSWEICLASCTDIFEEQNGFTGDWVQYNNPILPYRLDYLGHNTHPYCNPEIVKGQDNRPLKLNGRYYMYYLTFFTFDGASQAAINRAYSYDLVNWIEEGIMLNNRDLPYYGEEHGDNGDQSMCEFKGRTYLFYTHNINQYSPQYGETSIRYTIDDRPLIDIISIKP